MWYFCRILEENLEKKLCKVSIFIYFSVLFKRVNIHLNKCRNLKNNRQNAKWKMQLKKTIYFIFSKTAISNKSYKYINLQIEVHLGYDLIYHLIHIWSALVWETIKI